MNAFSFSHVATTLQAALGPASVKHLTAQCGGKRLDIPRRVSDHLIAMVGPDIAAVLVAKFGGVKIDVPSWGNVDRMLRAMRLKEDVVFSDLSANEIAHKHVVTSMWVRKLRTRLKGTFANPNPKPKAEKGRAP